MNKKMMIVLGVMVLLLYGYSYTEVGFTVSTIKETNIIDSIDESQQVIVSDSDKGLFVVIYGDQSNLSVYEFGQNPLTKRYSLITHRDIRPGDETVIDSIYHGIAKTSIYEIEYEAELDNNLIVFETANIRDDVKVRVAWDIGVVVLIILGSAYYRKQKNR